MNLINDILDLSKIESGTVSVEVEESSITDLVAYVEGTFRPVAQARGLRFDIDPAPNLPVSISTDMRRLQQVLKNLLSNAFKFTEKGSVILTITCPHSGWNSENELLNRAGSVIAFTVTDTGIGIPPEKQKIIFEAFQQADGSTSRRYGGTGLGLSISREITYMLGGEITLSSKTGKGSTFTLYLPQTYSGPRKTYFGDITGGFHGQAPVHELKVTTLNPQISRSITPPSTVPSELLMPLIRDDRTAIQPGDWVVLIVEDDAAFARLLQEMANNKGYKTLVTSSGEEAIQLAKQFPLAAVTLDILLPDMDGWTVLDRIKLDPQTMHVPVHIISIDDSQRLGLERGAMAYITKPVDRESLEKTFQKIQEMIDNRIRKLLVVDGSEAELQTISELIGVGDIEARTTTSGAEALRILSEEPFDCVVLSLSLADMSGIDLLEKLHQEPASKNIPVIVYSQAKLSRKDEKRLKDLSKNFVVKNCTSPERLLHETALFLHRVMAEMPEAKQQAMKQIYESDAPLAGRKVLVVDDDMRNLFALTAVLEQHSLTVITAENGGEAIDLLTKTPDIDLVLMDIMMPAMDGYETTQAIRQISHFKSLPIIALTAKAMKGDREKCLEAGASDYISKPVDVNQLLSLLRVWLFQ